MWRPLPAYELEYAPLDSLATEISDILDHYPRGQEVIFILRNFYPDGADAEVSFWGSDSLEIVLDALEHAEP